MNRNWSVLYGSKNYVRSSLFLQESFVNSALSDWHGWHVIHQRLVGVAEELTVIDGGLLIASWYVQVVDADARLIWRYHLGIWLVYPKPKSQ